MWNSLEVQYPQLQRWRELVTTALISGWSWLDGLSLPVALVIGLVAAAAVRTLLFFRRQAATVASPSAPPAAAGTPDVLDQIERAMSANASLRQDMTNDAINKQAKITNFGRAMLIMQEAVIDLAIIRTIDALLSIAPHSDSEHDGNVPIADLRSKAIECDKFVRICFSRLSNCAAMPEIKSSINFHQAAAEASVRNLAAGGALSSDVIFALNDYRKARSAANTMVSSITEIRYEKISRLPERHSKLKDFADII